MIYRFGNCELDTDRQELRVKGEPKALEPQVFHLLAVLVENDKRVLTRDELMDTVWQGRIVSDSTLASRIKSARQAIGDSGERQAFIQTVHGRGYRFVGSATVEASTPIEPHTPIELPAATEALPPPLATRLFDNIQRIAAFGMPRRRWLAASLLLVVVVIGIVVWQWQPVNDSSDSMAMTSIAVLPFADMSEAGDQAYFADGVAEEILNALAKVKGLRVVGRTSSFSFKGQNADVKTIGKQLNVTAVLEGSIRRSQDRVRITTQLVDTSSGYHLWSETYDRQIKDIFAIQDDIAHAVVQRLNIELQNENANHPLVTQETSDHEAYRLYLLGRYKWKRRYGDNIPKAIQFFKEAIARDPNFARVHAALASAYVLLPAFTKANRAESRETAERIAHAALKMNPELSEAHAVLGTIFSSRMEWQRADQQFQHAVTRQPVAPTAHLWYAVHSMKIGQLQQALTQYEKALSLDPAWGVALCLYSEALYALGQREAAIEKAEQAVALDYFFCQLQLRNIAFAAGDLDKAIQHYVEYKRLRGASEEKLIKARQFYEANVGVSTAQDTFLQDTEQRLQSGKISSYSAFYYFYHAKQVDRAMALFDAKAEPKFSRLLRRIWSPYGLPFRTHDRFASIAAALNLVDYWREFGWPDRCGPDPVHGVRCH